LSRPTDIQLLRLIRDHVDLVGLLAAHPEVSRADIEALWRRLGLEEPVRPPVSGDSGSSLSTLHPPPSTPRRPAAGRGLFDSPATAPEAPPPMPEARDSDAPRSHAPTLPPSSPSLRLLARSDGASRRNPGPAAIGVVIEDPSGAVLREVGERIADTTCNVAEYVAVLRAIKEALALGATDLTLLLDSELLVNQLRGSYKVKALHLQPYHRQALHLLGQLRHWQARHVPREQNARADALANRALDS